MEASTDVITMEQVEHVLLHGGELEIASTEDVQMDMIKRILASDSLISAFASFSATSCADIEGIGVTVQSVTWMRSAFKEGPSVYALLDCVVRETGEQLVVSMGGRSLMASFLWADRTDNLPVDGTFRREQSKSNPENTFWTFLLPDKEPGKRPNGKRK